MAYKKLKYWFDRELAELLVDKICKYDPKFNRKNFVNNVDNKVANLELKDRVEIIADELYLGTGRNYVKGISLFMKILGPENKEETGMFTEYYWIMPVAKFVEKYGLDHFDLSMKAISEITKRNTGEYAIRPYLKKYTDSTLKVLQQWSTDDNFHLRRLSSEGVRPRLPWAGKLDIFIENPRKIQPILENLKDDKVKFVQKSVANCLNDILKDNYKIGKELVEKWRVGNISSERKWIIKHALRSLRKKGDEWAKRIILEI